MNNTAMAGFPVSPGTVNMLDLILALVPLGVGEGAYRRNDSLIGHIHRVEHMEILSKLIK